MKFKKIIAAAAIIEAPFLVHYLIKWINQHGFFGGLGHWLVHGKLDPIYAFAEIDFLTLQSTLGLLLIYDAIRNKWATRWWFLVWCPVFLIAPSLGFLVYLLILQFRRKSAIAIPEK